jgi:PAS domain S-box-containing protein
MSTQSSDVDPGAKRPKSVVLVGCAALDGTLAATALAGSSVERHFTDDPARGVEVARRTRPRLIILKDLDAEVAAATTSRLRDDDDTRDSLIAVIAKGLAPGHADDLRKAGASEVFSPEATPLVVASFLERVLGVPSQRAPRISVRLPLSCLVAPIDPSLDALATNLSVHGMLLETATPLDVGTKLDILFRLPGQAHEVRVLGQVVRNAGVVDGRARSGVEFLILRGDARDRISTYVAGALGAQGEPGSEGIPSEERAWETELRASELRKAAILDSVLDCILTVDHEGRITEFNRAAETTFGYCRSEVLGRQATDVILGPAPADKDDGGLARLRASVGAFGERTEAVGVRKNGTEFPMELALTPVPLERRRLYTVCLRDITERRHLEAQFRQAQKMEAVGRLAGGVAHDFNNLLSVISGYAELVLRTLPSEAVERRKVQEILKASERAAGLTRQLLAFSRKQVLQPTVFDLNTVIADVERMLERLIGEDVNLVTDLDPSLGPLRADRGQIEQVLVNLVVNARDAMPRGGRITMTSRNVVLDEAYCRDHVDARPGSYVLLEVGDEGIGMDLETQRHVFEPFFTTKPNGKGTGLGLATVYGIVKQSGGYIWLESEPGRGTSFKIYLPACDGEAVAAPASADALGSERGAETILLLEDQDALRQVTGELLGAGGYRVLAAATGAEALTLVRSHPGPIHLLVTDVVMPGLSGPEVARAVTAVRPETRVLYTSGYTDDAVLQRGIVASEVAFIQKPFTATALASKVRELLDGARAGQPQ